MKNASKVKWVKMIVEADDLTDDEKIEEILEILQKTDPKSKGKKTTLWDRLTAE